MNTSYEQIGTVLEKLTFDESQTVLRFAEFLLQQRRGAVDARTARRKVSAWLVRDVGNLLMGGEPKYVPGEHPLWRVPVLVTHGRQGRATFVDVDAQTGDLLITRDTPQQVLTHVQTFIAGFSSN
ncbi:MAG: hypothetical protein GY832_29635 [Chloroflexi bacterium]|nr:hypothetical protein [Chloroflexota bacterium]